mmetsp:Transcript_16379/g.51481  ORF Transcript_16379/g.51481 Transcript_16379/m.51481 type:complete len:282 (+) Transcript_16379:756-1601(+)
MNLFGEGAPQGGEEYQLRPALFEQLEVLVVVEAEGLVAGHTHANGGRAVDAPAQGSKEPKQCAAHAAAPPGHRLIVLAVIIVRRVAAAGAARAAGGAARRPRARGHVQGRAGGRRGLHGEGEELVEVQVRLGRLSKRVDVLGDRGALGLGARPHRPPVLQRHLLLRWDAAKHCDLHATGFDSILQPRGVCLPPDLVHDDGLHVEVQVEVLVPLDDGRRAPGEGPAVHHQDDRGAEPLGNLRGASVLGRALAAVEETHRALDDGDVRVLPSPRDKVPDAVLL